MKTTSVLLCGLPDILSMLPERILTDPVVSSLPIITHQAPNQAHVSAVESVESHIDAHHPEVCIFLVPYKDMIKSLSLCLEKNIRVITAGPVPQADASWQALSDRVVKNQSRWEIRDDFMVDPHTHILQQAIQDTDFGSPVYYREINFGGPDLLSNWWRICRLYDKAEGLLDSEIIDTHVSANRHGQHIQISLTIKSANRSNAHVICTNSPFKTDGDLLLIGTGGVITYEGLHNHPGVFTSAGYQSIHDTPHPHILTWWDKIIGEETQVSPSLPDKHKIHIQNSILQAINQSIQIKRIMKVKYLSH